MYGALLGDMIGAPYEFDRGNKTKEFPLFCKYSHFTDDSVMTIAVAEALLDFRFREDEDIKSGLVGSMRKWGKKYPDAGYGRKFYHWLHARHPEPYGSYGNGSAMRVSSAGWLFETLAETRHMARLTAEVTHNHPEGIKGAEATASAIFLARTGHSKDEIRDYIVREFGYDLSRTCDQIRPGYYHNESCQKTAPEAITAFLEGTDFEDVIRTAVSLGGECDTLTCIAGSIAEAFYGVPAILEAECKSRLPEDTPELTPEPTIEPETEPSAPAPEIYKNPMREKQLPGQTAVFIAEADPYDEAGWRAIAPNGLDVSLEAFQNVFPSCSVLGIYSDTLTITNVSLDMNGWSFYCVFVNEGTRTNTEAAALYVLLPGQSFEG